MLAFTWNGEKNQITKQKVWWIKKIYRMKEGGALDWYSPTWIRSDLDWSKAFNAWLSGLMLVKILTSGVINPARVKASSKWQLVEPCSTSELWSWQLGSALWLWMPEWAMLWEKPIQWVPIKLASRKLRAINPWNRLLFLLKNEAFMHCILQYLPLRAYSV